MASSNDVKEINNLEEDEILTITPNGNGNLHYVYYVDKNEYDNLQDAVQYSTTKYGMPIFLRDSVEYIESWCIMSPNYTGDKNMKEFNSCTDLKSGTFNDENECQSYLNSNYSETNYTCSVQSFRNVPEKSLGFILNGNKYYLDILHINNSYYDNVNIIEGAFGRSNCTGNLTMSDFSKNLLSILGIQIVKAELFASEAASAAVMHEQVTCTNNDFSIQINPNIYASNFSYRCRAGNLGMDCHSDVEIEEYSEAMAEFDERP